MQGQGYKKLGEHRDKCQVDATLEIAALILVNFSLFW